MGVSSDIILRSYTYGQATQGRIFRVPTMENFNFEKNTGVVSIPMPEDEGDNAMLSKMMGAEIRGQLDFTIIEDGDHKCKWWNGSGWYDVDSDTLWEQIELLLEYMASGKMQRKLVRLD